MKFAGCNCPVGATYHALNCPDKPEQPQNLPSWAKPPKRKVALSEEPK